MPIVGGLDIHRKHLLTGLWGDTPGWWMHWHHRDR